MNYYIDTEFIEGKQKKSFWNFSSDTIHPTIDLISIGIVAEDGRTFYEVSNQFNIDEAWNRFDVLKDFGKPQQLGDKKVYWLRENVLLPIFFDLAFADFHSTHFKDEWMYNGKVVDLKLFKENIELHEGEENLKYFKLLLKKYCKTNKQIADAIIEFIYPLKQWKLLHEGSYIDFQFNPCLVIGVGTCATVSELLQYSVPQIPSPVFYGYYTDYDWVVFCWLFGNMMNLPKGFPKYCRDLQQIKDEIKEVVLNRIKEHPTTLGSSNRTTGEMNYDVFFKEPEISQIDYSVTYDLTTFDFKNHPDYPKEINTHNALADAQWNKHLHEFLTKIYF